jgi:hypothetical protein
MCPSAKQYLLACIEAKRSQSLNIHVFLSAIFLQISLCAESSCTQMHPKFAILHFILGVCVPTLHVFILYAMKIRTELWLC